MFIRLPNNVGIAYDLGNSDDFSPADFIEEHFVDHLAEYHGNSIAQTVVSHPHQDHIQQASEVNSREKLKPQLITLPHDVDYDGPDEIVDFSRIENDDNRDLIAEYKELYSGRTPPLQTVIPTDCGEIESTLEYGIYYMRPPEVDGIHPSNDHHYGNGLSICLYLRQESHTLWVTGDVTPEVHEKILEGTSEIERRFSDFNGNQIEDAHQKTTEQRTPAALLGEHGLTILVAPHHGLESCFCQKVFDVSKGNRSDLVAASEKRHTGKNDGKVDARYSDADHVNGLDVDIEGKEECRRLITTRDGHHMLLILGGDGAPDVILRKNPDDLLAY